MIVLGGLRTQQRNCVKVSDHYCYLQYNERKNKKFAFDYQITAKRDIACCNDYVLLKKIYINAY